MVRQARKGLHSHADAQAKAKAHALAHPHDAQAPPPGLSKLKSQLRQVKRLLLKDNLPAERKRDSERRKRALEGELEQALRGEMERKMAERYHMVKFFERQKVTRRLQRTKRELAKLPQSTSASSSTSDQGNDKAKRRKLEEDLRERRVDLNYILHYPKAQKYISLLKPTTPSAEKLRAETRAWVSGCMERGDVSGEPEVEGKGTGGKPSGGKTAAGVSRAAETEGGREAEVDGFFETDDDEVAEEEDDDEMGEEEEEEEEE